MKELIIYITSKFNFYKKKTETLLAQFWAIICITSELNFIKKTSTLLVQFWAIIYITSEFDFYEKKKKHFISSVFDNNLHNQ